MIMQEPIEIFSGCRDVIRHNLSKPLVVGNHKEVDHDDVAQLEFVDHIGDNHVAESIQNDESCLTIFL
jgi:hypothetical protein